MGSQTVCRREHTQTEFAADKLGAVRVGVAIRLQPNRGVRVDAVAREVAAQQCRCPERDATLAADSARVKGRLSVIGCLSVIG